MIIENLYNSILFNPLSFISMSNIFHYKNFSIHQDHAAMKVGTDSDLLGTMAEGGMRILDIGTGTGVLSLMLAQRYLSAYITAIEIDDNAVLDAERNFAESIYRERIELRHLSFQDYLKANDGCRFDAIVCNPPYFDKSTECPDISRTRARHTSSLPFEVLVEGAYDLLEDNGTLSVCIPQEVLSVYNAVCMYAGFRAYKIYKIKSLPQKPPKRYVLVHKKGRVDHVEEYEFCMRNSDSSRSEWYKEQLREFLISTGSL